MTGVQTCALPISGIRVEGGWELGTGSIKGTIAVSEQDKEKEEEEEEEEDSSGTRAPGEGGRCAKAWNQKDSASALGPPS